LFLILVFFSAEKKSHRNHRHHHKKKTVEVEPFKPKFDSVVPNSTIIEASKPKFDSVVPNSTVIEAPLPILSKAPETNELVSINKSHYRFRYLTTIAGRSESFYSSAKLFFIDQINC
jgi:hypothetical protein